MSKQTTPKERKENLIIAGTAIAIAVVMAVVSWMLLPDMVATQFKGWDTGAPDIPKLIAVAVPLIISCIFAVSTVNRRESAKACLIGYIINILFWIVNM